MREQIDYVVNYIKQLPIDGCITGSCLLGEYWEGMDVDCFVYDEKSFNKILFDLKYNPDFQILDKLEKWKFDKYINCENGKASFGITTIKFVYNTVIPVNIILKKYAKNTFSVLSSFDMDIISKALDIKTGLILDLSGDSVKTKTASWNRWNTAFYDPELWQISRILRQLERLIKYHRRGFNTDAVCLKYIDLIDEVQNYQSIFQSESFNETLSIRKKNTRIVKQICETWLKTHEMSDEQLQLLKEKIKEI